jgi:heterotetrameric sarcosine oxidase gamma subunit
VDFHPAKFPAGRCVRTRLAQVPVVIVHLEHSTGYELYGARSHADYLLAWLRDAALEWSAPMP